MIEGGVIRWIIQILSSNHEMLSDYTLEYATALLMNLSLRRCGKDECEQLIPEVNILKVLSEMMEHENLQVRTHVNGTLYSILTR
jgi:LisH domain-containing protein ARMC9